jgi:hypothetical protein
MKQKKWHNTNHIVCSCGWKHTNPSKSPNQYFLRPEHKGSRKHCYVRKMGEYPCTDFVICCDIWNPLKTQFKICASRSLISDTCKLIPPFGYLHSVHCFPSCYSFRACLIVHMRSLNLFRDETGMSTGNLMWVTNFILKRTTMNKIRKMWQIRASAIFD